MDVVSECRPAVQALVARLLRRPKDDPDVEDCTNEALRRTLEHGHRLEEGPVTPWVLGVARHVALDFLRAHYRQRARIDSSAGDVGGHPLVERLPDARSGPEALAAHRERAARLTTALGALPEGQRQALVLFHLEELNYREIAERLGVPVGTVGTWVLRARRAVATALRDVSPGAPS